MPAAVASEGLTAALFPQGPGGPLAPPLPSSSAKPPVVSRAPAGAAAAPGATTSRSSSAAAAWSCTGQCSADGTVTEELVDDRPDGGCAAAVLQLPGGGAVALSGRTGFALAPGALGASFKVRPPAGRDEGGGGRWHGRRPRLRSGGIIAWPEGTLLRLPTEVGRGFVSAMSGGTAWRGSSTGEPAFTMFAEGSGGKTCVDYIFVERGVPLRVVGRRPMPRMTADLPTHSHPSDHLPLCADLQLGWGSASPGSCGGSGGGGGGARSAAGGRKAPHPSSPARARTGNLSRREPRPATGRSAAGEPDRSSSGAMAATRARDMAGGARRATETSRDPPAAAASAPGHGPRRGSAGRGDAEAREESDAKQAKRAAKRARRSRERKESRRSSKKRAETATSDS